MLLGFGLVFVPGERIGQGLPQALCHCACGVGYGNPELPRFRESYAKR
jgi:hypothetical protein